MFWFYLTKSSQKNFPFCSISILKHFICQFLSFYFKFLLTSRLESIKLKKKQTNIQKIKMNNMHIQKKSTMSTLNKNKSKLLNRVVWRIGKMEEIMGIFAIANKNWKGILIWKTMKIIFWRQSCFINEFMIVAKIICTVSCTILLFNKIFKNY